jgi:hypothetical protein
MPLEGVGITRGNTTPFSQWIQDEARVSNTLNGDQQFNPLLNPVLLVNHKSNFAN